MRIAQRFNAGYVDQQSTSPVGMTETRSQNRCLMSARTFSRPFFRSSVYSVYSVVDFHRFEFL
jgi:hypothetical protein